MRTVVCVAALCVMAGCGAQEPDFSELYAGPRGVRFNDYSDKLVYESATWLVTDALLRVYDAPPFDDLVVVVGDGDVGDYRDGFIEVGGRDACERFVSFAHNAAHLTRELVEGDPDAGHTDTRLFGEPDSVENAPRNLLCPDPRYEPKD